MYTVGVKRRFWFGYRKVRVKAHDWQNGRFILNLADGSQVHIPGYAAPSLKVYADFWNHLAQIQATREVPDAAVWPDEPSQLDPVSMPVPPPDTQHDEVRRRASERVERILASNRQAATVRDRPEFS